MKRGNTQQHGEADVARYQTADISPTAPTIDDIHAALKTDSIFATEDTKIGISLFLMDPQLEVFTFGSLALDQIHAAQKDGISFVQHNVFTMPYDRCMYRATIKYDNASVGCTVFSLMQQGCDKHAAKIAIIRVVKCLDGTLFAMRAVNMMNTRMQPEGLACEFHLSDDEREYWIARFQNDVSEAHWHLTEGGLISMGLTMILNTKGILKERCAPPVKPNKARAAQGRPLLPYTTRVYTSVYNKAVEEGPVGTHASPRPHLRRAHLRHYPATEYREAYVLPIAAMLVNWDGKPLEARKEYIVK